MQALVSGLQGGGIVSEQHFSPVKAQAWAATAMAAAGVAAVLLSTPLSGSHRFSPSLVSVSLQLQ